MEHTLFLGIAYDWTSIATAGLILVTVFLVSAGFYQIRSAREEAKFSRTIDFCGRWDIDPVLDQSLRKLAQARRSGDLQRHPCEHRYDAVVVLNFLQSIVVGIDNGIFEEVLVRATLERTIREYVNDYVANEFYIKMGMDEGDFILLHRYSIYWEGDPRL